MTGPLRSQSGFSLIEAMIAIVIFAIGILGAYKMQIHSVQSNALGNRVSTSVNWATYANEELISRGYDYLEDEDGDKFAGIDDIEADADGALYILPDGSKQYDLSKNPDDIDYNAAYTPPANRLYSIFWNVVEGEGPPGGEPQLLRDSKLIRVRVFRNGGIGDGNLHNHDYYRSLWPGTKTYL